MRQDPKLCLRRQCMAIFEMLVVAKKIACVNGGRPTWFMRLPLQALQRGLPNIYLFRHYVFDTITVEKVYQNLAPLLEKLANTPLL